MDFYLFVRDLLEHFDDRADALCAKLTDLAARIFCSTDAFASFTGTDADYERYWTCAGDLGLAPRSDAAPALVLPEPQRVCEGFVIPSDICFAARAIDPRRLGLELDGTWAVAANALSYDYLWNEIRVKGGAYGCGFRASGTRRAAFYTYRDPAVDPSQERIARAGAWLSAFEPDEQAFEGFIVSCVSGIDAPTKPYALTKRRNTAYLAGQAPDQRAKMRADMLACTPERLRELGQDVTRIAEESPLCVFGGRELLEASEAGLKIVNLFE